MQKKDQNYDHLKDHVDYKKYQDVNIKTKYSVFNKRKENFGQKKKQKSENIQQSKEKDNT